MGRSIVYRQGAGVPKSRVHKAGPRSTDTAPPDQYTERLFKYIPSEAVGAYVALTGIATSAWEGSRLHLTLWVVLLFVLILTPLYLWRLQGVRRVFQLLLSTVAFAVWSFALGGPWSSMSWYEGALGSLVLVAFTMLIPLVDPPT